MKTIHYAALGAGGLAVFNAVQAYQDHTMWKGQVVTQENAPTALMVQEQAFKEAVMAGALGCAALLLWKLA